MAVWPYMNVLEVSFGKQAITLLLFHQINLAIRPFSSSLGSRIIGVGVCELADGGGGQDGMSLAVWPA